MVASIIPYSFAYCSTPDVIIVVDAIKKSIHAYDASTLAFIQTLDLGALELSAEKIVVAQCSEDGKQLYILYNSKVDRKILSSMAVYKVKNIL